MVNLGAKLISFWTKAIYFGKFLLIFWIGNGPIANFIQSFPETFRLAPSPPEPKNIWPIKKKKFPTMCVVKNCEVIENSSNAPLNFS